MSVILHPVLESPCGFGSCEVANCESLVEIVDCFSLIAGVSVEKSMTILDTLS
jgi:hypothetical protein